MAYAQLDDCTFYYELHGSGDVLVLLHGNGSDHAYFHQQVAFFALYYTVVVMDTRGHGLSHFGRKGLHYDVFADDVYALLQYLDMKKVHMLGFSDGGNTAILFALKYPDMLASLILNGANYHPHGLRIQYQLFLSAWYHAVSLLAKSNRHLKRKQQLIGLMIYEPQLYVTQLRTIQAKTLVLVGTRDMVKESHSKILTQHIPNASFVSMDGDHFIAKKHPDVFNQVVLQFLQN